VPFERCVNRFHAGGAESCRMHNNDAALPGSAAFRLTRSGEKALSFTEPHFRDHAMSHLPLLDVSPRMINAVRRTSKE
jgi:hypothetical protein